MLSKIVNRSRRRALNLSLLYRRQGSMATPASNQAAATVKTTTPHWPLSFALQLPEPQLRAARTYRFSLEPAAPPTWWSHRLYRGPEGKKVEILYSKTKAESEAIAQRFLGEPIIGFDMEWPWDDWKREGLQNKVGLIQIASEDKIGLIHIGLHSGTTTEEIIAPTLKKLIEDPKVGKVGVSILAADFARLSRFFDLKPKGALELSHLYRLVKFGPQKPELVSVKLVSLAQQVEAQLGLPLYKGNVRTSDWSKPLSQKQIDYAAGDAYAGYMLYKCMNAKRLAMRPTPPPPIDAGKYPGRKTSRDDPIILDVGDGTTITTEEFFGVKPAKSVTPLTAPVPEPTTDPLDATSQALYDALLARRALVAEKAGIQPTQVIHDSILKAIALARPHDTPSLLAVKGIGKVQQSKYGDGWLEVVSLFLKANDIELPTSAADPSASKTEAPAPQTLLRTQKQRQVSVDSSSSSSSPAFDDPPVPKAPQLRTGLSFTLAESSLGATSTALDSKDADYNSDDSLPSLDFDTPQIATSIASSAKRKRNESPTEPQSQKQKQYNRTHGSPVQTPPHPETPHSTAGPSQPPPALGVSSSASRRRTGTIATPTPASSSTAKSKFPRPFSNDPSISHARAVSQALGNNIVAGTSTSSRQPSATTTTTTAQPVPIASDPELASRIAKSKLLAFSNLVASKLAAEKKRLQDRDHDSSAAVSAPQLVTPHTLDLIVQARPQTQAELERIPGVDGLLVACEKTGMNLLRNVVKFVGAGSNEQEARPSDKQQTHF